MAQAEDRYYVPHGTHWPIIGSIGLTTLVIGAANLLNGSGGFSTPIMWAGVAIVIYVIQSAVRTVVLPRASRASLSNAVFTAAVA